MGSQWNRLLRRNNWEKGLTILWIGWTFCCELKTRRQTNPDIGNYNTCNECSILPKTRGEIYNLSLLFHPQCDKPNLIEKVDAKSYCSILLGLGCFWNSLSIKSLDLMSGENYEIKKRLSKHVKTLLQKLVLSVDLLPIVLLLLVLKRGVFSAVFRLVLGQILLVTSTSVLSVLRGIAGWIFNNYWLVVSNIFYFP